MIKKGALCDDCISILANVKPRQTVNSLCRKMLSEGNLSRQKGKCSRCRKVKVINKLSRKNKRLISSRQIPNSKVVHKKMAQAPNYSTGNFPADQFRQILQAFSLAIKTGKVEIYNEFSLQHELGIYLRNNIPNKLIQFERNVSYFGFNKSQFTKKEIDIVIFSRDEKKLDIAIELKFPKNGQYPEQMFSFCKDIKFTEELKRAGFDKTYVVIFADDRLFYSGNQNGVYGFFRGGKSLQGVVVKPTGNKKLEINIKGNYQINWNNVSGTLKYTVIEAQ